jgi:hypothetical protein
MTVQTGIEWPTCDEDGCIGVRLAATPKCLAHARDEQRDATLKQLGETGEIDARGVPITWALLEQILTRRRVGTEQEPGSAVTSVDSSGGDGQPVRLF